MSGTLVRGPRAREGGPLVFAARMSDLQRSLRVLFIHGLEGSPRGAKAQYLAARFDAHTPAMDTSDLAGCIETQAHAAREAIIPRAHSEALAATGSPDRVRLVVVDDEHRLDALLAGDGLADLVRDTLGALSA